MMKKHRGDSKKTSVRLPEEIWVELQAIADEIAASKKKRMTRNNLVVLILKKFITEWRS